ncbi:MAG: sodium ion-translocating decarboxylase subunit beta [Comamonadaceae bacterium]|nr:sodium ion-translocating decarboxylase subunit beta [Comamonadaceae bacterium]
MLALLHFRARRPRSAATSCISGIGGKYNPIIGIAGVSCVPTTAKVVQKIATRGHRRAR